MKSGNSIMSSSSIQFRPSTSTMAPSCDRRRFLLPHSILPSSSSSSYLSCLSCSHSRGSVIMNTNLSSRTRVLRLKLVVTHQHRDFASQRRSVRPAIGGVFANIAGAKPEEEDESNIDMDTELDKTMHIKENRTVSYTGEEKRNSGSQLEKRLVSGLCIGIFVGSSVLVGGWVFAVVVSAAIFIGSREFFELVRSRGIADGMTPPPRYVSRVCSIICAIMPLMTLYFGHMDISVTSSAFIVAMALVLQQGSPRFSQLSSTIFGLFYCGYLPCFWIKLRCGLAVPALNTKIGATWPFLLGGQAQWTVGLVATLISISSIIAADTTAYVVGKAIGRTPLTNISPKKTLEGALAGLMGCITVSIFLSKILYWPNSLLSASAYGVLNFMGSLFGDLIESLIKRDAGVKDSGSLIPGHDNECIFS